MWVSVEQLEKAFSADPLNKIHTSIDIFDCLLDIAFIRFKSINAVNSFMNNLENVNKYFFSFGSLISISKLK